MSASPTPATAAPTQAQPAAGSRSFSRLLATLVAPLTHLLNSVRLVVFLLSMLVHDSSEYSSTPRSARDRQGSNDGGSESSSPPEIDGRARPSLPSRQSSAEVSGGEGVDGLAQQQDRRRGLLGWYWIAGRRKRAKREVSSAMGWAFGWAPVVVLALAAGLAFWGVRVVSTRWLDDWLGDE